MKAWTRRFNIYLSVDMVFVLVNGCKTDEKDKQLSTLRVHIEAGNVGDPSLLRTITMVRSNPVLITIARDPVLTEANVLAAKVVDNQGGFAIEVQFDENGSWLLEQYSSANPGRHFVIFSLWGDTPAQSRWLAAPLIAHRIGNGRLVFTPDASREEAEKVALGLNNAAKKFKGAAE